MGSRGLGREARGEAGRGEEGRGMEGCVGGTWKEVWEELPEFIGLWGV